MTTLEYKHKLKFWDRAEMGLVVISNDCVSGRIHPGIRHHEGEAGRIVVAQQQAKGDNSCPRISA